MWIKDAPFERVMTPDLPITYDELLDYFTGQGELDVNPDVNACRDQYALDVAAAEGSTPDIAAADTAYWACIDPYARAFSAEAKAGVEEPVYVASKGNIVLDGGIATIVIAATDGGADAGESGDAGEADAGESGDAGEADAGSSFWDIGDAGKAVDRMLRQVASVSVEAVSTRSTTYDVTINRTVYACPTTLSDGSEMPLEATSVEEIEAQGCEVYWSDTNIFSAQRAFAKTPYHDIQVTGVDPEIFSFIFEDINGDNSEEGLMFTYRGEVHAFTTPIIKEIYDHGYTGGCSASPTSRPHNFGIGRALDEAAEQYRYLFRSLF